MSGSLWRYYRDEPAVAIVNSKSFKSKIIITENTHADGNTTDVEIAVPLKYLSNFWRTLEMSLTNDKINLILTWSANCVISFATRAIKSADTKY